MAEHLVIYGDSISNMNHGGGGYQPLLERFGGFTSITTEAIGGSGLSKTTPNSLRHLLENPRHLYPKATTIIIWHGSNDWYYGTPMNQFQNDLIQVISTLKSTCSKASVVLVTPLPRFEAPRGVGEAGYAYATPNRIGCTLKDYMSVLRQTAEKLDIPLFDMGSQLGHFRSNLRKYYEDGVHPSVTGYREITKVLLKEFRKLT